MENELLPLNCKNGHARQGGVPYQNEISGSVKLGPASSFVVLVDRAELSPALEVAAFRRYRGYVACAWY